MTLHPVPLGGPSLTGIKLKAYAVAVPALSSHIRPALVLAERESRAMLDAARAQDVSQGGRFSAIPACIQVWDRSWSDPDDPGQAVHLGSVDWSYDTPVRHYVTIYRAMVTQAGLEAGESTLSMLQAVMSLTGIDVDDNRITMPAAPARDPFRRSA
ncbi:MAG: hypothetical protein ACHQE5_03345 [Actinomycetes bacterium]